jgi:hypothetical protein
MWMNEKNRLRNGGSSRLASNPVSRWNPAYLYTRKKEGNIVRLNSLNIRRMPFPATQKTLWVPPIPVKKCAKSKKE